MNDEVGRAIQAIEAIASSTSRLSCSLTTVTRVSVGKRPLQVDGSEPVTWDPFRGLQAVEAAITNHQTHCATFKSSVIDVLNAFPMILSVVVSDSTNGLATALSSLQATVQ